MWNRSGRIASPPLPRIARSMTSVPGCEEWSAYPPYWPVGLERIVLLVGGTIIHMADAWLSHLCDSMGAWVRGAHHDGLAHRVVGTGADNPAPRDKRSYGQGSIRDLSRDGTSVRRRHAACPTEHSV